MKIYLVDGTYELFRAYYGMPKKKARNIEVGGVVGLLASLLALLRDHDVSHIGCAFDHTIESFRNDLFEGYKSSQGVEPELLSQFPLAEEAVGSLGLTVWPMEEFEADDALATAAAILKREVIVDQIIICSPDKDLAQCVQGARVVCWDRRRGHWRDEEEIGRKFGVCPRSIPDWLALVGDQADGFPGVPGWGPKSASKVLAYYKHLESIPQNASEWKVQVRGSKSLAGSWRRHRQQAFLYRQLATLREDVPLGLDSSQLKWKGAIPRLFGRMCRKLEATILVQRVSRWQK